MITELTKCRICNNSNIVEVCNFGVQYLTGVFPKNEKEQEQLTSGPLILVKCHGENCCGLLQLKHSFNQVEMYGENYGYRSGLNKSMVDHLKSKVSKIESFMNLNERDLVIDIGSNDSTLLRSYEDKRIRKVGIDPTGNKFKDYYPEDVQLIADFFSANKFKEHFGNLKAKVITSISMFYDLESPYDFVSEIVDVLDDEGIWIFEQSYMPSMLETRSFDTVCHEHLEYYALKQIKWMLDKAGLKIIDLEFNDVNGGSFSITAAKANSKFSEALDKVQKCLESEVNLKLDDLNVYQDFYEKINESMEQLKQQIKTIRQSGKSIYGLGASTKGNVLLQYCGLGPDDLNVIGEVNEDKFGLKTPGTKIPIISENELLEKRPDFLLVLPWHFADFFKNNNKFSQTKLIFPLPRLEIFGGE